MRALLRRRNPHAVSAARRASGRPLWTLQGQGYMVRDITGHGHDLYILAEPQWVPVDGIFAECGNGVVETGEQCDDGSRADGDGCSRQCTVRKCLLLLRLLQDILHVFSTLHLSARQCLQIQFSQRYCVCEHVCVQVCVRELVPRDTLDCRKSCTVYSR